MSKAVILKGPQADSKSFITVLPDTMDALLNKARSLFNVPPNHTPHFTLAEDTNVIVLPDFLPLIREREILIFRWTPDTPRSSLRRSLGQAVLESNTIEQSNVATSSVEGSNKDESNKLLRGVRWDESVVSNEEKNKRQMPRPRGQKESRDSVASRQRAEYVKQKIQEQEELQKREQQAQPVAIASTEPVLETVATEDPFVKSSNNPTDVSPPLPNKEITKEDLMASGSSPPGYSSPTPKLTLATMEEEQQTSSPLASPTRDIRGARKTDHSMAWMMGLGVEKQQQQQLETTNLEETKSDGIASDEAATTDKAVVDEEEEIMHDAVEMPTEEITVVEAMSVELPAQQILSIPADSDELEEERAVEQATSPQKKQDPINVKDIPAYQTMKSVVNQLRSHPSNQWFRQPCQEDLQRFCQERNRPVVDLFTISNSITLGEYGLDEPLKHFKSDLDQMWNNIRTFYPPQSQQSHCASMLETFSGILLEEWKRNSNTATRAITIRPVKRQPHSTPISRGEKHPLKPVQDGTPKTQQQAYFASLVAKAGLIASSSPSSVGQLKSGHNLKRSAPLPANKSDMPNKRATLAAPAPVLTVTNDNSIAPTTTSSGNSNSKADIVAPRLITRGLAKRFAA